MLHLSLNKLFQRKLFGSGFPISPSKDYPIFFAEDNYTGIYDPTRIDPNQYTSDIRTSKKEKHEKITIENLIWSIVIQINHKNQGLSLYDKNISPYMNQM